MNWSSLLPHSLNKWLNPSAASDNAVDGLRDFFIYFTFGIGVLCALLVLWQTWCAWKMARRYLTVVQDGESAVLNSDLPYFQELRHHLLDCGMRDGSGMASKRRTVDAAEVFRESAFAPAFASSRLILAVPSILTGLGVLGTFVGLALGLGSLDMKDTQSIETSIKPLIQSFAAAFSSSVWGVMASLVFSGWEKLCEGWALGTLHKLHTDIDAMFPRYVPEEAMSELERTSRGTKELLTGLAAAIGDQMQQAIGRLGKEIKDAVLEETGKGQEELGKAGATLISEALTTELGNLKDQIGKMSAQFSERFDGAANGLMTAVQGFQPVVKALSGTVETAQTTVNDAVKKLNAHEGVMKEMAGAATNIRKAADTFGAMNDTLTLSANRNEAAANAQLSAAQANERVAEHFGRIGERLPEIRQTLEDAAKVIATITGPILDLKVVLDSLPKVVGENNDKANSAAAVRDGNLLLQTENLVAKVKPERRD